MMDIMEKYPIGSVIVLEGDDPGIVHEVIGYEVFMDHFNILFRDGIKLNSKRVELILEVA